MLVARWLNHLMQVVTLSIIDGVGRTHRFGSGEPPSVTVRLHDRASSSAPWPRPPAADLAGRRDDAANRDAGFPLVIPISTSQSKGAVFFPAIFSCPDLSIS